MADSELETSNQISAIFEEFSRWNDVLQDTSFADDLDQASPDIEVDRATSFDHDPEPSGP